MPLKNIVSGSSAKLDELEQLVDVITACDAETADAKLFESEKTAEIKELSKSGSVRDTSRSARISELKQLRDIVPFKLKELESRRAELEAQIIPLLGQKALMVIREGQRQSDELIEALIPVTQHLFFQGDRSDQIQSSIDLAKQYLLRTQFVGTFILTTRKINPNGLHWSESTPLQRFQLIKEVESLLESNLVRRESVLTAMHAALSKSIAKLKRPVTKGQ